MREHSLEEEQSCSAWIPGHLVIPEQFQGIQWNFSQTMSFQSCAHQSLVFNYLIIGSIINAFHENALITKTCRIFEANYILKKNIVQQNLTQFWLPFFHSIITKHAYVVFNLGHSLMIHSLQEDQFQTHTGEYRKDVP